MKSLASKKKCVHRTEAVNAKNKIFRISNIFVADEYKEKCYRIVQLTYNSSKLELSRKVPFFS